MQMTISHSYWDLIAEPVREEERAGVLKVSLANISKLC